MRLVMHSYTFRGYSIQHALEKCKTFGYEAIELNDAHFQHGDKPAVENSILECEKAGVPVAALDTNIDLTGSAEKEEKSFQRFLGFVELAQKHGIPRVNGGLGSLVKSDSGDYSANGSILLTDEIVGRIVAGMKKADALLAEHGVEMTLEMHMNHPHDSAASIMRLLNESGAKMISANHDPGNLYAIDHAEEAVACLEAVKSRLTFIHLKNCRRTSGGYSYTTTLDRGDIDYYRYFLKVKEIGYDGDICIEYCGEGDPHIPAQQDAQYVRYLLEDLAL